MTAAKFKSFRGPAPQFLMAEHPDVQKPLLTLPPHSGAAKLDVSRGGAFGQGQLYLAIYGDQTPLTGMSDQPEGFQVVRVDLASMKLEPFFRTIRGREGPKGMEFVVNPGFRRSVDVRLSPTGDALYVADMGAAAIGAVARPFPGTGVIWRITR